METSAFCGLPINRFPLFIQTVKETFCQVAKNSWLWRWYCTWTVSDMINNFPHWKTN